MITWVKVAKKLLRSLPSAVSCGNYRKTKEQLIFVKVAKKWPSPSPIVHQLDTLDSGINVAPWINIAHGTFAKNIKGSP